MGMLVCCAIVCFYRLEFIWVQVFDFFSGFTIWTGVMFGVVILVSGWVLISVLCDLLILVLMFIRDFDGLLDFVGVSGLWIDLGFGVDLLVVVCYCDCG